jgi:Heterokaryon incompatibility protein (HET)
MFQLLMPTTYPVPLGVGFIKIQNCYWVLTETSLTLDATDIPEYTCVSYVWGSGRRVNPLNKNLSISDKTILALEATIKTQRPKAIWIDALCVPPEDPAKTVCLLSMGMIYSKASQVVVVLSESCSNLLEQIHKTGCVDTDALLSLENDKWVTRAWTYQEVVNSKSIHFVIEKGSDISVNGDEFLNCVGYAIYNYTKTHGYDSFKLCTLHPRLDSLESLILDWKTADYLERSAYQIMSAMVLRESENPKDRSYAMVGAITNSIVNYQDYQHAQFIYPAEHFMQICEAKGDYSFIYSTAPRSDIIGKFWRPVADAILPIVPIFPWPSYGEGQSGCIYSTHIQLNNMCRMFFGKISSTAREFLEEHFQSSSDISLASTLPIVIFRCLKDAGFLGCGQHIELESGYFFPQTQIKHPKEAVVFVARGVRWPCGAPGLIVKDHGTDVYHFCEVGVFVGSFPKTNDSVNFVKVS